MNPFIPAQLYSDVSNVFQNLMKWTVISIIDHPFKGGICTMIMANIREAVEVAVNSTHRNCLGKLL